MRFFYLPIFTMFAVIFFSALVSCSKPVTKQKVTENIEDARKATAEAKEATRKAIESREQLYVDYRETKVEALEDKMDAVEDRIGELRKTSKKSENVGAKSDISSAVNNLEKEKGDIRREIDRIKAIPQQDWTRSYQVLEQAITQIEQEIQSLTNSLEDYE